MSDQTYAEHERYRHNTYRSKNYHAHLKTTAQVSTPRGVQTAFHPSVAMSLECKVKRERENW